MSTGAAVSAWYFQRHFTARRHDFLNISTMTLGTFRGFIVCGKNQPFKFLIAFPTFKLINGHFYLSPFLRGIRISKETPLPAVLAHLIVPPKVWVTIL